MQRRGFQLAYLFWALNGQIDDLMRLRGTFAEDIQVIRNTIHLVQSLGPAFHPFMSKIAEFLHQKFLISNALQVIFSAFHQCKGHI